MKTSDENPHYLLAQRKGIAEKLHKMGVVEKLHRKWMLFVLPAFFLLVYVALIFLAVGRLAPLVFFLIFGLLTVATFVVRAWKLSELCQTRDVGMWHQVLRPERTAWFSSGILFVLLLTNAFFPSLQGAEVDDLLPEEFSSWIVPLMLFVPVFDAWVTSPHELAQFDG